VLNRVTLIGHVGQEPEIRHLDGDRSVATLSVATSERWNDKQSGEKMERTEWHRIVVWPEGLVNEVVAKYVHKGSKLYVEGKLQTRKWQDQQGNDRYSTEVVLNGFDARLQILDKVNAEHERRPPPLVDDDIPF